MTEPKPATGTSTATVTQRPRPDAPAPLSQRELVALSLLTCPPRPAGTRA